MVNEGAAWGAIAPRTSPTRFAGGSGGTVGSGSVTAVLNGAVNGGFQEDDRLGKEVRQFRVAGDERHPSRWARIMYSESEAG
jgi:hypothetical protein